MMVLIAYDIKTDSENGDYRLRVISKICKNYGQRVQNSVFECIITPAQLVEIKTLLKEAMDTNIDSIRLYNLGVSWEHRVEHIGAKMPHDLEDTLIL